MGVLEGVVVAVIVLAGVYVGYHAWQESLYAPEADAHESGPELMYSSHMTMHTVVHFSLIDANHI